MLTFNAERHEYRWHEKIVPSVTQALAPLYDFSFVSPDVLERKCEIGVAVHMAVQFDLNGTLDESTIDDACAPHFAAWRKFRAESGFTEADVGNIEEPFYHPTLGYAGTPDLTLFLFGRWSVVDLKNVDAFSPVWALQTAAYKDLLNVNANGQSRVEKRYSLQLKSNGAYKLVEHTCAADMAIFMSALNLHRWRIANLKDK